MIMTTASLSLWIRRYAIAAGAMDFLSGLLIAGAPGLALRLMQVPVPTAEALVFVRFVGAFVAAVGAMYLWAARAPGQRLRVVLGATILPRIAAGSYVAVAVATGGLPVAWLTVTASDYALVAVQLWILRREVLA